MSKEGALPTHIDRPRKLAFTWTHEMQPQWVEFVPKIEESWRSMMKNLDRLLS